MMEWINNIQALWGLPHAYRLEQGGSGNCCVGHNEPTMRSSAVQGKVTLLFFQKRQKGINF